MNTNPQRNSIQRYGLIIAVLIASAGLVWLIKTVVFDQAAIPHAAEGDNSFVLSLDDGDFVKGSKKIIAASTKEEAKLTLLIDGKEVKMTPAMEQNALLTFEAEGIEAGYKNSVLVNDTLVHVFEHNITSFTKVTVPVPAALLKPGNNIITFRSGNRISPSDVNGEHDDWRFRALTFELGDGTVLDDPGYKTATTYTVGDGQGGKPTTLSLSKDFDYTIKDEKFRTFFYTWDTTPVTDGSHNVRLIAEGQEGQKAKQVTVQVDNTPPTLHIVSPVNGRTYKNKVNVTVSSTDESTGSGNVPVVIKLDGKLLEQPAEIDTTRLAAGEHKLDVSVSDKAGNGRESSVTFRVLDEKPDPPALAAPADLSEVPANQAALSAHVSDPTNDPMKVSFYKAKRYDLTQPDRHLSYVNAVDREPPLTLSPPGEAALTKQELELLSTRDGNYLETNNKQHFPYHRFSFEIGTNPPADTEVVWTGHSLPERLVTLYLWNFEKSVWDGLDSNKGTNDFTLRGKITPEFVRDGRVEVLVQDRIPSTGDYDFAFVWMTDTQYYSESYPHIYDLMTQWIVDNWKEKKFKYLLHTGDIVNNWNSKTEWERASRSMKTLDDAGIPYGIVAGNHDVYYDAGNYEEYWKYFGRERYVNQPSFGGDLNNNRDHYDLISVNGYDFVIVYLGWLIDQKSFDWASGVLKKYADRNAIIATHEYLKPNRAYYGQGGQIWEKLVVPNPNVFMVLGGHNPGAAYNIKKSGGRAVLEMLSDYQNGPEGGQGFLRFLQFDVNNSKLLVNTYSPYLKKWNYFIPEEDEFVLPLQLKPIDKQVATDYIGIFARTNELIGQVEQVPGGSTATLSYTGLLPGQQYDWYVVAQDEFGGHIKSDVWSFRTK